MIKDKVNKLIELHNTACPYSLAEASGIYVKKEELGNIYGYYSCHFRIPIIHLNQNLKDHEAKFVCSHELGHGILHPRSNTPFLKNFTYFPTDRIEKEANKFAVELMIPDYEIDNSFYESQTIFDLGKIHGVPEDLVHLKEVVK